MALGELQRLRAAAGQQHRVPRLLQHLADQGADDLLVFGHEDRLGPGGGHRDRRRRSRRFDWCVDARQVDPERGPRSQRAAHGDLPAALAHDAVHGRESEAGAFAALLGREKRLEHAGERGRVHAAPGIRHLDQHVASVG